MKEKTVNKLLSHLRKIFDDYPELKDHFLNQEAAENTKINKSINALVGRSRYRGEKPLPPKFYYAVISTLHNEGMINPKP